jgi:competence protein ComEC
MFQWIPYAFVRIVVFFMAGILWGIFQPESISLSYTVTIFFGLLGLYFLLVIRNRFLHPGGKIINPGFVGLAAILVAGYMNVLLKTESTSADHLLNVPQKPAFYKVVVTRYAEQKSKSWKLEAVVQEVYANNTWQANQGKVVLYLSKPDYPSPFGYGDVLLIKGCPQLLQPPANPGEFDYKKFLAFRNIYHQHFLRQGDAVLVGSEPPSILMKYAIDARLWAEGTLEKFVSGDREKGIASALVLGVTDGLDHELMNAYAATGTLHVLAVSGLHISIIYLIILWLLQPLNKSAAGKWALAFISLFVLWTYAFVTGLSPSVLRAVTMFSFVALAKPWNQKLNIYNTLAASAFFLLLFDPQMIMSVGFQLSYAAVLGIVYLHPKLYPVWEPESRLLDEVWKITSVSLAAQVATLPLGLLYFHQFPNYFMLSNLLVIPASFVVLIAGLSLLAVSFFSVAAHGLGWVVTWMIKAMNIVVFTVGGLPYSQVENIYITTVQSILLAGMIISVLLLIEKKKFYYSIMTAVLAMLFCSSQWQHFDEQIDQRRLVVYNVPGHSAADLMESGHTFFLADSALNHDPKKISFHITPARLIHGIQAIEHTGGLTCTHTVRGGSLIAWRNRSILILDRQDIDYPASLEVDYVIIRNNAIVDLNKLLPAIKPREIIIDSSNSFYHANRLLEQAGDLAVSVHSVLHAGAYQKTI